MKKLLRSSLISDGADSERELLDYEDNDLSSGQSRDSIVARPVMNNELFEVKEIPFADECGRSVGEDSREFEKRLKIFIRDL